MNSLEGHFLISAPELAEPFHRSVILMVRHNDEGALGLIVNRRTTATVKQVWDQINKETPCEVESALRLGGPCQGPLMALHAQEFLLEIEVLPGVYFTAGDKIQTLVAQGDQPARFFVGYAGWSAGQLENELARGSWLTTPASAEQIFGADDELWTNLRKQVSGQRLIDELHIKHAPDDPRAN